METNEKQSLEKQLAAVRGKKLAEAVKQNQELKSSLVEKDKQILELRSSLAKRDKEILELNSSLAERDKENLELNSSLVERDKENLELRSRLAEKDAKLAHLVRPDMMEPDELMATLSRIQSKFQQIVQPR